MFVVLPWFILVILAIRHAKSSVFTDDHHGYFVCAFLQFNVFYYTDMFPYSINSMNQDVIFLHYRNTRIYTFDESYILGNYQAH